MKWPKCFRRGKPCPFTTMEAINIAFKIKYCITVVEKTQLM